MANAADAAYYNDEFYLRVYMGHKSRYVQRQVHPIKRSCCSNRILSRCLSSFLALVFKAFWARIYGALASRGFGKAKTIYSTHIYHHDPLYLFLILCSFFSFFFVRTKMMATTLHNKTQHYTTGVRGLSEWETSIRQQQQLQGRQHHSERGLLGPRRCDRIETDHKDFQYHHR